MLDSMPKIPDCDHCQLYAYNPYLICAVHPDGVEGDSCLDFRPRPGMETEELWTPDGATYYNGELVPLPKRTLTREEQWTILDTHPLFTNKCPECGYRFNPNDPPPVHWDCPDCGWVDDTV